MIVWSEYMQKDFEEGKDTDVREMSIRKREMERKQSTAANSHHPTLAESAAVRFFDTTSLALKPDYGQQSEWDLRAAMEKKRWKERQHRAWEEHRAETLGRYPSVAADWRTDVRIQETEDPDATEYREWSIREIWELITQHGEAADPRVIPVKVRKPASRADFVEEGFVQNPEIPVWLESQGKLMREEEERDTVDDEAEAALLTSEFSDFDTDFDFDTNE